MKPEIGKLFFEGAVSLGDFVSVVDGNMVDATGMNVDWFAEEGVDDGGTFKMPAGIAGATEKIPTHGVVFAFANKFPDCKVGRVFLFAGEFDASAGFQIFEVEMGEVGIPREFRRVKVNSVGSLVSVAVFDEFFDEGF